MSTDTAYTRARNAYLECQKESPGNIRFVPVTADDYNEALCVLPPAATRGNPTGFLMGEEYTHTARGHAVYYAFLRYGPNQYACGLMTRYQFNELGMFSSVVESHPELSPLTRTIVLNGHTLGVIFPNGLQILRSSVLRGSPYPAHGVIAFDPVLQAGQFRNATEDDFREFGVVCNPHYLEPLNG